MFRIGSYSIHFLFIVCAQYLNCFANQDEPACFSRWDYEYKTISQISQIERKQSEMEQEIKRLREAAEMQQKTITMLSKTEKSGSAFTRWGRNVCPDSTALVYKGYIAGKKYNEAGSGSDTICLPDDPTWANYTDGNQDAWRGRIYGTEIDINEPSKIFPYNVNDQDVPCVVCLADQRSVLMFPARADCYKEWSLQYSGYLMANSYLSAGPHNHICVDSQPEFVPNGARNDDQHILYLIEAQCGSLPCPPYVQGRELSCVVCSKNND